MADLKNDDQLNVKMPKALKTKLQEIAAGMQPAQEAADLLRQAAVALVECAAVNGARNVPLEMAIVQRIKPTNPLALAAEAPGNYGGSPVLYGPKIDANLKAKAAQAEGSKSPSGGGALRGGRKSEPPARGSTPP